MIIKPETQTPKDRLRSLMCERDEAMTFHQIQELYNQRYPGVPLTTAEINSLLRDKRFMKVGKVKVSSWTGRKSFHAIYRVVA